MNARDDRGATDARRVHPRDAARRAGDLPEGPRPDPDARRHLPGGTGARVRGRLGRAHDDAAARDRPDRARSPATSSATTSPIARAATSRASSAPTSRSPSRSRDVYDGIDGRATWTAIVLDLPEPWRVVEARRGRAPAGRDPAVVPADHPPGDATLRETLAASVFGMAETIEVLQRGWNVEGAVGAPRPPDGRPHRFPHRRPGKLTPGRMNLLDVVVLAAVAAGAVVGFRVGFVVRALSWLGLTIGLLAGLLLTPRLARALTDSTPGVRLLAVASLLVGLAPLGHTRRTGRQPDDPQPALAARADRARATASPADCLGALGALVLLWLLLPRSAVAPGWPAQAAQRFQPRRRPRPRTRPDQPPSAARSRSDHGRGALPAVFDGATRPSDVGAPPHRCRPARRRDRRALRRAGRGAGVRPELSPAPASRSDRDLVATNAHVVAGETHTSVVTARRRSSRRVGGGFDGRHDIAILRVDGASLPPLTLGSDVARDGRRGARPPGRRPPARDAGAGRPSGSTRRGPTSTGARTIQTSIVGLAAHLIVGRLGRARGGFRRSRAGHGLRRSTRPTPTTAFAIGSEELAPFVARAADRHEPTSTGSCLVD